MADSSGSTFPPGAGSVRLGIGPDALRPEAALTSVLDLMPQAGVENLMAAELGEVVCFVLSPFMH